MIALRPTEPDEATLIQLVLRGNEPAFVALMRRDSRRVFRIARSILSDDAEAEDAAQDAWVLAYRHLDKFEGRSSLSAWVGRIVSREALARTRRRRLTLVGDVSHDIRDGHDDPERQASHHESRASLERAIDGLPESFRAVFVLRAVEEMSVAETASCLGVPEETVKTRLDLARCLLREDVLAQLDFIEVFGFAGARCNRIVARVLARIAPHTHATSASGESTRAGLPENGAR